MFFQMEASLIIDDTAMKLYSLCENFLQPSFFQQYFFFFLIRGAYLNLTDFFSLSFVSSQSFSLSPEIPAAWSTSVNRFDLA